MAFPASPQEMIKAFLSLLLTEEKKLVNNHFSLVTVEAKLPVIARVSEALERGFQALQMEHSIMTNTILMAEILQTFFCVIEKKNFF